MSAVSTRPSHAGPSAEERPLSRLDEIQAELDEAASIETEAQRSKRVARLKSEAEELGLARMESQRIAGNAEQLAREQYLAVRDAYVTALDAFLGHAEAIRSSRQDWELSRSHARAIGVKVAPLDDLAVESTRSENYALRQTLGRCQQAGMPRAFDA
jgi:hypothetical protein